MQILYIMCGLPFSGKSTLSREISNYLAIPRISFDETWQKVEKQKKLVPGENSIEQWKYICDVCEQDAKHFLKSGISVVYDNLGTTKEQRNKLVELARNLNSESRIIYIDITKEEVKKRREQNLINTTREQVSDENFNNALSQFEIPSIDEKALIHRPKQDIKKWIDENKLFLVR